jgi:hypothetical protein
VSQAVRGAKAESPAAAGRKGFKAELDGLRERMRALEFGCDEIAAEVSRRYRVRPRQAYRLAWGWTQDQAAARFNERAADQGTDPGGRASMTGPHLCEVEKWPGSSRKPSVYVLCLLAGVYETDVRCLLDLADHESLPQQDRLVLMRRPAAQAASGEGLLPRAETRGLSLTEAAGDGRPLTSEGMSLTLPYVPARMVIEVSGPAANPGLLAGASGAAPGRLTLVPDRLPGTEVAGR